MRNDDCAILPQTTHVNSVWNIHPPDEGGQRERGGTNHIFGVLPQGTTVGKMPGTGIPCGVPKYGEAAGKFHVQVLSVLDSGGPVRKGSAAPLRHVWNAHASRAAHWEQPDGNIRTEHADEVESTGCGDSGKLCGGKLQPHGG